MESSRAKKLYTRQRGCNKRFLIDKDNRSFPTIRVARGIVYNIRLLLSFIDPNLVNNPPVPRFG